MRLGFIGTGTIASAVVSGLSGSGHAICVSRRSEARSAALAAAYPEITVAENQAVIDASDVVFLGLMADAAPAILRDLRFRPGQRVISFMAGLTLGALAPLVAPAAASAIMLPFPGIAQGGSPILALGDTTDIDALFGATDTVFALKDEAELQAYVCAQAVLSPAVAMVARAADWIGAQGADRAAGETFLRTLVGSSLLGSECGPMIEALNTPGGYNQRLRQHMERAGMPQALWDGLDALNH
ncbi:MAG: pyrroline-5-carboxylate reductase [Pararhodobacter sp.]